MARTNNLSGWVGGEPPVRDDGSLAIVELRDGVMIDIQGHYGLPIIVACLSGKLHTTAGAHRLEYVDVVRYIDIAV